jgi:hypothetical protein
MELKRICGKCGQAIDLQRESWSGTASGVEHKSCPASAVIQELPGASAYGGGAGRPQFVTVAQAAGMLSVSAKTITRRIQAGELPAKHLRGASGGGRGTILIDQADVLALLEDYKVPA